MARKTRGPRPRYALEFLESRTFLNADLPVELIPIGPTQTSGVLVRFMDDAPEGVVQGTLDRLSARVKQTFPDGPRHVELGAGIMADWAVARLNANPHILYAEMDETLEIAAVPNDPRFGNQWGLHQSNDVDINAPEAWDVTTGSTSVVVAVTDTGIDYTHPDLYLNIAINQREIPDSLRSSLADPDGDGLVTFRDLNHPTNSSFVTDHNGNGYIDAGDLLSDPRWADGLDTAGNGRVDDLTGWNHVTGTNNPWDGHSHGTHVSGTVAATTNNGVGVAGVNGNARIMPLKWFRDDGTGSISLAVSAIHYAADNGARVINASWGGGSSAIRDAIAYAGTRGVVFVASAGNEGGDNDVTLRAPSSYPLANIISVAAVTSSGALASFSNYGTTTVHVGAPGSGILSTMPGGGYGNKSGTSMAAPHVAGVVSLVAGLFPHFSAEQLIDHVLATTKPLASLAGKTVTGGMIDAYAALTLAAPPTTPQLSAPTGLMASSVSSSEIQLTWNRVEEAIKYVLERSLKTDSGWSAIITLDADTTAYLDNGLAASTTYSYRVRAVNDTGESPFSDVARATTLSDSSSKPSKGGGNGKGTK